MRRLGRMLIGVVGALMLLGTVGVGGGRNLSITLTALLGGGLAWAVWAFVQRRRPMTPTGWVPTTTFTFVPTAGRPTGAGPAVSLSLARVEARELVTSTTFGVGIGFCLLVVGLFGLAWGGDYGGNIPGVIEMGAVLTHPLAGMLVLGSFRARTRARRDGAEELFTTCPVGQTARTTGHLLTAWVPALMTVAMTVGLTLLVVNGAATPYGEIGARQIVALLAASLLSVGAVCLGVALARWVPWTIVPIAAVIGVGFLAGNLATSGTATTTPKRQLSTVLVDPEIDLRLTAPHWVAHHLWILSLVAIVAVLALLRDHRRPITLVAGAAAVAMAVASGVAATRPIDTADAQRIAAILGDPASLPCLDALGLAVCTFPDDDELRTDIADAARDVAAVAPEGALDGWSVRQTRGLEWDDLDPEVMALLGGIPAPDPHVIPIEFTAHPLALEALRLWTGLAATGVLDDRPPGTDTRSVRGQARGAIALWLATHGLDDEAKLDITSVGSDRRSPSDAVRPWPDTCYAGDIPVQWAATDVTAARKMLSLPSDDVRRALLADWDHLTDRSTTTDELMEALGLGPVGMHGFTSGGSAC